MTFWIPVLTWNVLLLLFAFGGSSWAQNVSVPISRADFEEMPSNVTVAEGQDAVFRCRVRNLPTANDVSWNIDDGLIMGWGEKYRRSLAGRNTEGAVYFYPEDGDTSLGVYDLVLYNVSWKDGNTPFECQLRKERKRSSVAYLKVTVSPKHLEMSPTPKDGVVNVPELKPSLGFLLSCSAYYSSAPVKISWYLDGTKRVSNWQKIETKVSPSGRMKVYKTISKFLLPLPVAAQKPTETQNPPRTRRDDVDYQEDNLRKLIITRQQLEGLYHSVYRVTCQVDDDSNERSILRQSAWITSSTKKPGPDPQILRSATSREPSPFHDHVLFIIVTSCAGATIVVIAVSCMIFACRRWLKNATPPHGHTGSRNFMNNMGQDVPLHFISAGGLDSLSSNATSSRSSTRLQGMRAAQIPRATLSVPAYDRFEEADCSTMMSSSSHGRRSLRRNLERPLSLPGSSGNAGPKSNVDQDTASPSVSRDDARQYQTYPRFAEEHPSFDSGASNEITTCTGTNQDEPWMNLPPLPPASKTNEARDTDSLPPLPPSMDDFSSMLLPADVKRASNSYEPAYNVVTQCSTFKPSPGTLPASSEPECDWQGSSQPPLNTLV